MRLLNKVLLPSLALLLIAHHADALDALEKCELVKLRALQRYSYCFLQTAKQQIRKPLTVTERTARLASCETRFKKRFEQAVAQAARRGASCPNNAKEALETVYASLTTAQVASSSQVPSCNQFGTTTRCVFEQSQEPFDLKAWVENNYSSGDLDYLVIRAEAWGGQGNHGHSENSTVAGGAGGAQGYAQTTWSWSNFTANGTTDLYIYVGEKPECGGCAGSSSMILFKSISKIGETDTGSALLIGGGGGGGGGATSSDSGEDAGRGGILYAGDTLSSAAGVSGVGAQPNGGNQNQDGEGGPTNHDCSDDSNGYSGIGGYGGRKDDDSDSDRAGWKGAHSPLWTAGGGGLGSKKSGGTGGGGYGGGGGNCSRYGGGGGGSLAASLRYDGDTVPIACGASGAPNSSGTCLKGGNNGLVVLNFVVSDTEQVILDIQP